MVWKRGSHLYGLFFLYFLHSGFNLVIRKHVDKNIETGMGKWKPRGKERAKERERELLTTRKYIVVIVTRLRRLFEHSSDENMTVIGFCFFFLSKYSVHFTYDQIHYYLQHFIFFSPLFIWMHFTSYNICIPLKQMEYFILFVRK